MYSTVTNSLAYYIILQSFSFYNFSAGYNLYLRYKARLEEVVGDKCASLLHHYTKLDFSIG